MHPARAILRHRAPMIPQCLVRREEPTTRLAREFTDLVMLRNLMSQPVMLAREPLSTAERAWVRGSGLGFVRLSVYLQSVLARETTSAAWNEAWVSSALSVVVVGGRDSGGILFSSRRRGSGRRRRDRDSVSSASTQAGPFELGFERVQKAGVID